MSEINNTSVSVEAECWKIKVNVKREIMSTQILCGKRMQCGKTLIMWKIIEGKSKKRVDIKDDWCSTIAGTFEKSKD